MADPVGIASFIYTLAKDVYSEYKKGVINIPGCHEILQSYIILVEEIDHKQREKMQESPYVRNQLNKSKKLLESLNKLLIQKGEDKENVRSNSGVKLIAELKELKDELLKAIPLMENDVIARLIQSKDGIQFWKSNFGDAMEVRIEDMGSALAPDSSTVIIPAERYRVFFPAIHDDMVSVRDFSRFVEMFSGNEINCSGMDATFDSLGDALFTIMKEHKLGYRMFIRYDKAIRYDRSILKKTFAPVLVHLPAEENFDPESVDDHTLSAPVVVPRIRKHIANKWHDQVLNHIQYFHGLVDKSHLPELFKNEDGSGLIEGSYLLRYSSNADNSAAFSFIKDGQLRSISIKCRCINKSQETLV